MIYILSWTTKKHQTILSRPLHSKLKKIQGLAQKFKDFSRKNGIQGLPLKFKDFSRLWKPWYNCHFIGSGSNFLIFGTTKGYMCIVLQLLFSKFGVFKHIMLKICIIETIMYLSRVCKCYFCMLSSNKFSPVHYPANLQGHRQHCLRVDYHCL